MNKALLRIRNRNNNDPTFEIIEDEEHNEESDENDAEPEQSSININVRHPNSKEQLSEPKPLCGESPDGSNDVLLHIEGNEQLDDEKLNPTVIEYENVNFFIDFKRYAEERRKSKGLNKINILQYLYIGKSNIYPLYTADPDRCELYVTNSRQFKRKVHPLRRCDGSLYFNISYNKMNVSVSAGLLFAVVFINNGKYEDDRIVEYIDGNESNFSPYNIEYIKKIQLNNEPMITPFNVDIVMRNFVKSAFLKYTEGRPFIKAPDVMIPYFKDVLYKIRVLNYIVKSRSFNDSIREKFINAFYNYYLTI